MEISASKTALVKTPKAFNQTPAFKNEKAINAQEKKVSFSGPNLLKNQYKVYSNYDIVVEHCVAGLL